jgi:hypothetical protein
VFLKNETMNQPLLIVIIVILGICICFFRYLRYHQGLHHRQPPIIFSVETPLQNKEYDSNYSPFVVGVPTSSLSVNQEFTKNTIEKNLPIASLV